NPAATQAVREDRHSGDYHFVNIPTTAPDGYDAERDDPEGKHLVARLERYTRVLADKTLPKGSRAEALQFVVHLIGDAHQPLHCAERDADKGGNESHSVVRN